MKQTTIKPLINLYNQMDNAWDKAALSYNFQCTGCEDNCCKSLFFHHTFIEKVYFLNGFKTLHPNLKKIILQRAENYCKMTFQEKTDIKSLKIMCPVNEAGQCLLYDFRPMICRLHGLPHELSRPGHPPVQGPGCDAGNFEAQPYTPFDRTIFYRQMAQIEMNFRKESGLNGKIKQSIAQMLLTEHTG